MTAEKKTARKKNCEKPDKLHFGEAYRTTKKFLWSNFDKKLARITVPADELLIYRSTQKYRRGMKLALFYWLKERTTVCLAVTDKSVLYVKHMDWIDRHRSLKISEREDDTTKFKIEAPNNEQEQQNTEVTRRKPVDS